MLQQQIGFDLTQRVAPTHTHTHTRAHVYTYIFNVNFMLCRIQNANDNKTNKLTTKHNVMSTNSNRSCRSLSPTHTLSLFHRLLCFISLPTHTWHVSTCSWWYEAVVHRWRLLLMLSFVRRYSFFSRHHHYRCCRRLCQYTPLLSYSCGCHFK